MATLKRFISPPFLQTRRSLFFLLLLISGSFITGLMTLFYQSEKNSYLETIQTQERYALQMQKARVKETFASLLQDLFFLRDQNELIRHLQNDASEELQLMAREYLILSTRSMLYDQIRFLDRRGMEVVRVNYNNGQPAIVPEENLQDKSKRYYFKDSFSLDRDEVYFSPFDLNVEQGQVEHPLKPVIRIGTAVLGEQGQKQGIILLNYLGRNLLDKLIATEGISPGNLMLVNRDGYWLLNRDREQEWGFMFSDKLDRTFANSEPEVWKTIREAENGQIFSEAGLFTFATIRPIEPFSTARTSVTSDADPAITEQAKYHWSLISLVDQGDITAHLWNLLLKLIPLAVGVFFVSVAGSWLLANSVVRRRTYQEQLKTMAYFDALTDLPNRRHFFDRLEQTIAYKQRYGNDLALLYIDLDGFKQVNDTLGHESGDAVLRQAGKNLQEVCRKTDILARLGGDEFALLMPQYTSIEDVALVAEKIIATLSAPLVIGGQQALVGASIGIALYPADCKHQQDLLNCADAAMYHAKSRGKNQYLFYNELPEG